MKKIYLVVLIALFLVAGYGNQDAFAQVGYSTGLIFHGGGDSLEVVTDGQITIETGGVLDILRGSWKIGGVEVTSSAAELNYVDGVTLGTSVASKILGLSGDRGTNYLLVTDTLTTNGVMTFKLAPLSDLSDSAGVISIPSGVFTISGLAPDGSTSTIKWNDGDVVDIDGGTWDFGVDITVATITAWIDSTNTTANGLGVGNYQVNSVDTDAIRDGTIAPVDLSTDFNDMFTYQLASTALALDADIHLLLAWITPITTEMDLSPHNHDMTYVGTMTADDQIDQGLVYALDMDGVDDGGTITDHTDFFFDDAGGANGFTTNAWVYVVAGTDSQMILAKYDLTAGNTAEEWAFFIDEDEYLSMMICDDSEPSYESMQSDAALTTATWYMVTAVYDGAGGGSASAGITLYVDGVAVAATAVDNGSYTGMENLAALVYVSGNEDGDGNIDNVWTGDLGDISQSVTQLTSDEVWELYVRTRGYYNQ